MTDNTLKVWFAEQLVGSLWEDSTGKLGFAYTLEWQQRGFAISQQLPLNVATFPPEQSNAQQFFANLLPEATAREHIVRDLKIADSDFGLLKAIGGECAGAFSILLPDEQPQKQAHYSELNDENLTKLLLRKGQFLQLNIDDEQPRLSLAGAQDKCPIYVADKKYYLPRAASPSSHILKFEIADYKNIPLYECFLTNLAKAIDLPTVNMELKKHDDKYYLLIERYDRYYDEKNQLQRLHQEDFCQALGFSYRNKYQQENGPSFKDCYHLLQQVSVDPLKDVEQLLRWQIFNVLVGNSDAHAKNLALLYDKKHQARLAPFYDLVCTRAIARIDINLAMAVGNEFNPNKLQQKHWHELAVQCGVRPVYVDKILQDMREQLPETFKQVHIKFTNRYGEFPALQRIKKIILKQCREL